MSLRRTDSKSFSVLSWFTGEVFVQLIKCGKSRSLNISLHLIKRLINLLNIAVLKNPLLPSLTMLSQQSQDSYRI